MALSFRPRLHKTLDLIGDPTVIPPGGYLPRDGSLPMTGDLDMGGNDINNVASVNGSPTLNITGQDLTLESINNIRLLNGFTGIRAELNTDTLTSTRIFTFPNSSGTFALTSNLNAYLLKSGDTMTGNILFSLGTGIDTTLTGGSDVLNIGTTNADIINIGNSGATINIQGTTFYQNVTELQVTDKLFTVNKGGSVGSGTSTGFEIEENALITGWFKTNGTRNGWDFRSPAIAFTANLLQTSMTADRSYTLPNASGTIALTTDLSGYVPEINGTILIDNESSPNYFALTTDSGAYVTPWLEMDPTFFYLGADIAGIDFGSTSANDLTIRNAIGATGKIAIGVGSATPIEIVGASSSIRLNTNGIVSTGNITISDATLYGSNAVTGNLYLSSTSDVTKGYIHLGSSSAYDETNTRLGIGTLTPQAVIDITQGITRTAWTTTGAGLIYRASTFTDTTSVGAIGVIRIHNLAAPTFTTSSATTPTAIATLFIEAPVRGANVTGGTLYSLVSAGETWCGASLLISGSLVMSGGNINLSGGTRTIGLTDANILQFSTNNTVRLVVNSGTAALAIGTTSPSSVLHIQGSAGVLSSAAWTTNGIGIRMNTFTFTDTTSSGTVARVDVNTYGVATLAASSVTTYTTAYGNVFNAPAQGTNVIITNSRAALFAGSIDITGTAINFTGSAKTIGTNDANTLSVKTNTITRSTWASTGEQTHTSTINTTGSTPLVTWTQPANSGGSASIFLITAGTLTGQTASTEVTDINWNLSATKTWATGAITTQRDFRIQGRTYAFVGSSTITDGVTLEINSPTLGTNALATRLWNTRFIGTANVGIGGKLYIGDSTVTTAPLALLHLAAGTATANTAPVKYTSGPLNTTAESGTNEYNNSFYQTKSSGLRYGLGGAIFEHFTDAGNGTTVETDLYSDTFPANTFLNNGESTVSTYAGTVFGSTSNKRIRAYFAGTLIMDTGALAALVDGQWSVTIIIIRVSSSVVRTSVEIHFDTNTAFSTVNYTEVTGLTLSGTNILKITGTASGAGAATNDIIAKMSTTTWNSASNL